MSRIVIGRKELSEALKTVATAAASLEAAQRLLGSALADIQREGVLEPLEKVEAGWLAAQKAGQGNENLKLRLPADAQG